MVCYGAETAMTRSIRSGQAQDWEETVVMVVDVASTGNSRAIPEKLSSEDLRIKLSVTSLIEALTRYSTPGRKGK